MTRDEMRKLYEEHRPISLEALLRITTGKWAQEGKGLTNKSKRWEYHAMLKAGARVRDERRQAGQLNRVLF